MEAGSGPIKHQRRRKILPQNVRNEFLNKGLLVCDLEGLTATQEEDLFARVQKGLPLTAAEKLRGTTGPWQHLASLYEIDFRPVIDRAYISTTPLTTC